MIEPTAEICPCDERKKLITDENAVPNITIKNTSKHIKSTSATVRYQAVIARYIRHAPSAIKQTMSVETRHAK